jgi:apolipoprotein N-acyltransferase
MAVMTNDAWWGDTPGYRQHFRYAALRAIENRRDVAQAANTGYSGFFNQRGDVLQRSAWWTEEALSGEVHLNKELTPFTRHGDVIGRWARWISLLLALLSLASFVLLL